MCVILIKANEIKWKQIQVDGSEEKKIQVDGENNIQFHAFLLLLKTPLFLSSLPHEFGNDLTCFNLVLLCDIEGITIENYGVIFYDHMVRTVLMIKSISL